MPSPFPDTVPSGYPSFAPLFEGSINLSISTVVPYLNLLWLPKKFLRGGSDNGPHCQTGDSSQS